MRRQHRGGTRVSTALLRVEKILAWAAATTVVAAIAGLGAPPSADARASCAPKPGEKQKGAAFQYCPKEVKRTGEQDGVTTGTAGSAGPGQGQGQGQATNNPNGTADAGPNLPLLGYPSTSGVNALLIILLLGVGATGALGVHRWRQSAGD